MFCSLKHFIRTYYCISHDRVKAHVVVTFCPLVENFYCMSLQFIIILCIGTSSPLKSCTCPATPLAFIALLLFVGDTARPGINQVQPVSVMGGVKSPWSGPRLQLILSHMVVYMLLVVLSVRNGVAAILQPYCRVPVRHPSPAPASPAPVVVLDLTEWTGFASLPACCDQHPAQTKRKAPHPTQKSTCLLLFFFDNDDQTFAVKLYNALTALCSILRCLMGRVSGGLFLHAQKPAKSFEDSYRLNFLGCCCVFK